jgi:hypothetical protein
MQLTEGFACDWCGREFVRRYDRGRRPLYCTRTCRQRAYESRRRGALSFGLPKPTFILHRRPAKARYQGGVGGFYLHVCHALRPDGAPDHIGFRPSLCGAYVKATPHPFFPERAPSGRQNCETCEAVARRHPPDRLIDPVIDVGSATALIAMLRTMRHAPEPLLRATVDQLLAHAAVLATAPETISATAPAA